MSPSPSLEPWLHFRGSGLVQVSRGSQRSASPFHAGSSPRRERAASGRLSSLMVMISLACVPFCSRARSYITLPDPGQRPGRWHHLHSFVPRVFTEHLRWARGCARGSEQIKKHSRLGLYSGGQLLAGGDGGAWIAALTGLVSATPEPVGGLLYQPWEQRVGRHSGQASWRQCYGC